MVHKNMLHPPGTLYVKSNDINSYYGFMYQKVQPPGEDVITPLKKNDILVKLNEENNMYKPMIQVLCSRGVWWVYGCAISPLEER